MRTGIFPEMILRENNAREVHKPYNLMCFSFFIGFYLYIFV